MHRTVRGSVTGALLTSVLLACGAAGAGATGTPAKVTFRAEGDGATLVPLTSLTTTTTPVVKDGTHACSGTSAGGALDRATAGDWQGTYFGSFGDYLVDTIKGETPDASSAYWSLWVNGRPASTGACGTELQAGDSVLFFEDRFASCDNPSPPAGGCRLPLAIQVPATAVRGHAFSAKVVSLTGDGGTTAVGGASVTGAGATLTSGAGGGVGVTPSAAGTLTLRAAKTGLVRSAPVEVCVQAAAGDGTCGTPDRLPPLVHITSFAHHRHYGAGAAPRTIAGRVGDDPSGLANIVVTLTGRDGRRCSYYDAVRETYRRAARCAANAGRPFSAGDRTSFSYLLPETLPKGRWLLKAIAIDKAGNRTPIENGASLLSFFVDG